MIVKDNNYKNISKHVDCIIKKDLFSVRKVNMCPHCQSVRYIKYGKFNGIQRFKCKECGKTFSTATNSIWSYSKKSPEKWIKFIELILEKKVLKDCAESLEININTAFAWRHKVLDALVKNNRSTILGGAIHMIKTSMKESFKGSKNIKTCVREKVFIVSAKSDMDEMISIPLCKKLWFWNKFEEKICSRIDKNGYIIPYLDRYICLAAKKYNKNNIDIKIEQNDVISDFSRLSKNWFKTFKGIATKYLGGYLSWFILFCKDKEFKDVNLIYELIAE